MICLIYCSVLNNNSSSHVQSLTVYVFTLQAPQLNLCHLVCLLWWFRTYPNQYLSTDSGSWRLRYKVFSTNIKALNNTTLHWLSMVWVLSLALISVCCFPVYIGSEKTVCVPLTDVSREGMLLSLSISMVKLLRCIRTLSTLFRSQTAKASSTYRFQMLCLQ